MVLSNLLLIAGTGNKSGKTTFACRIIEQFRDYGIIGIKITPHFHETTPGLLMLSERKDYTVYEETNTETQKDTSRMLRAGASHVYFAKVTDKDLSEAFMEIMNHIPGGVPVVCESPALRLYVTPGLFVIMKSDQADIYNNINKLPHVMIHLNELTGTGKLPLSFEGGKWIYTGKLE